MENVKGNELIAEFMGVQRTDLGWYDAEELLQLGYTMDNTFDELLFHRSWDWLMCVVHRIQSLTEEPEEIDHLKEDLWFNEIKYVYKSCVVIIEGINSRATL